MNADAGAASYRLSPLPSAERTAAVQSSARGDFRRQVRRVAPRSVEGILLSVVRRALEPSWSPDEAALAVAAQVGDDPGPLRRARAHLRVAMAVRATLCDVRALATLNIAISSLEPAARADPAPSRA